MHKVLPKAGLNGFDWRFVQSSTAVFLLNFCTKNPRLRQYPNRPMWQNPLCSFGYAESGILPHRFGGLHPQMLLVATRTSHICEFAKSQERKQTSFSGLRKSAEPLGATPKHNSTTNTTKQNANTLQNKKSCKPTRKPMLLQHI